MTAGVSGSGAAADTALRVLVLAPTPFFGDRGCHVRIYEEVRALTSRGVRCRIVTYPTGGDRPDVDVVRAVAVPGVDVAPLGFSPGRPLLDLSVLLSAYRQAARFRPHVIHAHLHEGIAIGVALRAGYRVPLIADLQGSLVSELVDQGVVTESGLLAGGIRQIERWLVRRPSRVLTSSGHGVSLLAEQGVDPRLLTTLPDGVDVDVFSPRAPDPALLARLDLVDKRVVVFLGVLTDYQGVDVLLDVATILSRRAPDIHLLVLGYPNEEHYRAQARARGLTGVISFPGRVPYTDAPDWLALGTIAVSPKRSLTEANGKLLNYMACGLPVVATETPVNKELLGEAGVFAPIGDADHFANRILELFSDPAAARRLGDTLRERAETVFSWSAIAAQLEHVYRDTLSR